MKWILIWIIAAGYNGGVSGSAEFDSEEGCNKAKAAITAKYGTYRGNYIECHKK